MPAGIEIKGSAGSVQIDSNFRNPMLVAKGTLTLTANDYPNGWYKTVTYAGNNPMIAFGSVTDTWGVMCIGRSYSNGVWTFGIKGGKQAAGTSSFTVTYYIFDVNPPGSSSFGVQVFRADGTLAFDGGRGCMKVYGVYSPTEASPVISLPSGNWAVVQTCSKYFFAPVTGGTSMLFGHGMRITSTSVGTTLVPVSGLIGAYLATSPRPTPYPIMVIDVTGM